MNWYPVAHFPELIEPLRSWILDRGSLTARLQALAQQNLDLKILRQQMITEPEFCSEFLRESLFYGDGQPWVFCQAVFSPNSQLIPKLDETPLGVWLFREPNLIREDFELTQCVSSDLPVSIESNDAIWGRRSIFIINQERFLLREFFLPSLVQRLISCP